MKSETEDFRTARRIAMNYEFSSDSNLNFDSSCLPHCLVDRMLSSAQRGVHHRRPIEKPLKLVYRETVFKAFV